MPYILSPLIKENSPGMWSEGNAYEKRSIYSIEAGKLPPVNYDEHILRSHSLTHLETPAHTANEGQRLGFFLKNHTNRFYGKTVLIKLKGNKYLKKDTCFHWIITKEEIIEELNLHNIQVPVPKILISTEFYPQNNEGFHDPNYVLTLSQEAADFLISMEGFELYGTSWKSSDFNPGKPDRLIHNTIFQKALILENLNLKDVPAGIYFMVAFPLPISNSSESPVVPVLFEKHEINNIF